MDTGSLADWLGAIGSVGAVGAALYLHWQTVGERKEIEASQSRSAALSMLAVFRAAAEEFEWTIHQLDDGKSPNELGTDEDQQAITVGRLIRFRKELLPFLQSMAALGSAAPIVQAAYAAVDKMVHDFEPYFFDIFPGDPVFIGERWPASEKVLRHAADLVQQACEALEKQVVLKHA
ncbi:hypothetical protein ACCQ23_05880 [Xanthomonas axonopodis pv. phyllanthi]|uniref:hypothetical protein n=1 Tax=Xanthomonas TaxID=338 RepID=UPI0012D446BF|nr:MULTISPECIES: hypothetical protein [Xanthomonas]MEA9794539.1 hypothetical protein [Xanthomonas campestris pv. raphani]